MKYIQLTATAELPDIAGLRPFKALLIADEFVSPDRQAEISHWLVESGCLYLMSWGQGGSSWNDAVNLANLKNFNFDAIPDQQLVITTCHENESLEDMFWFCRHTAMHPSFPLDNMAIVHVGEVAREAEFLKRFNSV